MDTPLRSLVRALLFVGVYVNAVAADDRDPPPALSPDAAAPGVSRPADADRARPAVRPLTTREILAKYSRQNDDAAPAPNDSATPKKDDADQDGPADKSNGQQENGAAKDGQDAKKPRFDPAVVSAGEAAFNRSCTGCHDAEKSYSRTKSLSGWRACILRMAAKSGADIPNSDVEPIATYLTSRNASSSNGGGGDTASGDAKNDAATETPPVTIYGTLSPTWRDGSTKLENPGFFPDTWVGANWQTSTPVSAKITACTTCHEGAEAHRIELVEASMKYDLSKLFDNQCGRKTKASIEAGRFVVPFGAFSSQSNPGVYRTVSKPLIFDMGQRARLQDIGDSVLPMPYSDQGMNFEMSTETFWEKTFGASAYIVNGLQGGTNGVDFYQSRAYNDNNALPAGGTRVTWGDQSVKLGASFMSGQFSQTGGVLGQNLYYRVWGWDLTLRHKDRLRVQFEYARRDSDIIDFANGPLRTRDHIDGFYVEGEYQFAREKKISLITRYDWLHHQSMVAPFGSVLQTGTFGVGRFTYGLNFVLANGSLLMINAEHWMMPGSIPDVDALGLRWACTF